MHMDSHIWGCTWRARRLTGRRLSVGLRIGPLLSNDTHMSLYAIAKEQAFERRQISNHSINVDRYHRYARTVARASGLNMQAKQAKMQRRTGLSSQFAFHLGHGHGHGRLWSETRGVCICRARQAVSYLVFHAQC
jgi:hypothetical protein